MNQTRILVVDDEPKLVRLAYEVLTAMDYEVITANNGRTAIEKVALEQPDLVLLDIVLADELDGYQVCRNVREFSEVPVIMLTAKARESDVLEGFDAGADDYITKPFSAKELVARVQAVLKRAKREAADATKSEIDCGRLHIDLARRRVTRDDEEIHLTRTEYNLLHELIRHRNQVLLHEHLLSVVWGPEYRDDIDYLRAYVRHLRRKLEVDPANPRLIVTSPGIGYMVECPEQE